FAAARRAAPPSASARPPRPATGRRVGRESDTRVGRNSAVPAGGPGWTHGRDRPTSRCFSFGGSLALLKNMGGGESLLTRLSASGRVGRAHGCRGQSGWYLFSASFMVRRMLFGPLSEGSTW